MRTDIRDFPDAVNAINHAVNRGNIAEIKLKAIDQRLRVDVVEIRRKLIIKDVRIMK